MSRLDDKDSSVCCRASSDVTMKAGHDDPRRDDPQPALADPGDHEVRDDAGDAAALNGLVAPPGWVSAASSRATLVGVEQERVEPGDDEDRRRDVSSASSSWRPRRRRIRSMPMAIGHAEEAEADDEVDDEQQRPRQQRHGAG